MSQLEWVFAYGSNMNLDDLRSWLQDHGYATDGIVAVVRATLRDYRLVWNYHSAARRGGAANIEPAPGAGLPGVALQMHPATRDAIDRKEGHPTYYSRGAATLDLQADDGATIAAWVYVARPERCHATPQWPTRTYRDLLVTAAVAHGLPAEHVAAIRAVTVRD